MKQAPHSKTDLDIPTIHEDRDDSEEGLHPNPISHLHVGKTNLSSSTPSMFVSGSPEKDSNGREKRKTRKKDFARAAKRASVIFTKSQT